MKHLWIFVATISFTFAEVIFTERVLSVTEIEPLTSFVQMSKEDIEEVLPMLELGEKWNSYLSNSDQWSGAMRKYRKFYRIDLTGDGNEDIIFNGYFAEEGSLLVWVQVGTKYVLLGDTLGSLKFIGRENQSSKRLLVVHSQFCCASEFGQIGLYGIQSDSGALRFELIEKVNVPSQLEYPTNSIKPVSFSVKNEFYHLRYSPTVNNDTIDYGYELVPGNVIASYTKDAEGKAFSSATDSTGRVWWLVVMDSGSEPTYDRFHEGQDSRCGWMSSNFLRIK